MAINMNQRFLTGLAVFDTYSGLSGNIVSMYLDNAAVPPLAPLYTGAYFVVQLNDSTLQTFTASGKRIDHTTGIPTGGVTLLANVEYYAALGAGYPASAA